MSTMASIDDNQVTKRCDEMDLNHYCFAIDLRSIVAIDVNVGPIKSSYLQFCYPFFGYTDNIKTFPSITVTVNEDTVIPHGFCAFNFATTDKKLKKTFKEVPLIIEMIEETTIKTIVGTAKIDLFSVYEAQPNRADDKKVVNTVVPVMSEQNKTIAQIQIIMFLQNCGKTKIPLMPDLPDISVMKSTVKENTIENIDNLDHLLTETALEIELWKEKQMILFRERLKQNEEEFNKKLEEKLIKEEKEIKVKFKELTELENKFLKSLEELKIREQKISYKESQIDLKQKEINLKFENLNEEISQVMNDLKDNYEQRMTSERNKCKEQESGKWKIQEKVYFLERKLKEKDNIIKELEEKINQKEKSIHTRSNNLQTNSLVRTTSLPRNTTPKTVLVTREPSFDSIAKNIKTLKTSKRDIFTKTSTPMRSKAPIFTNNRSKNISNTKVLTKVENLEKSKLIEAIKQKRNDLISRGVHINDPIIQEIDSKLNYV
ncbi:centrosomal protein of 120 kDa-like [Oppia nitens]|uniref:centrosomal protein of 120 kDa-like n=1 Tax=Oppia nitens TaxID=1686743 RepID=UPI0023DA9753|nr:centrosomal protein of 120 kDa-like [Oppia nitens]